MEFIDFNLPDIVFLEQSEHDEINLSGRTVIQHNPSHTILEVIALDDLEKVEFNEGIKTYQFEYLNIYGVVENHLFAVHFTLNDLDNSDVFLTCADWYREYLSWEDRNIDEEEL